MDPMDPAKSRGLVGASRAMCLGTFLTVTCEGGSFTMLDSRSLFVGRTGRFQLAPHRLQADSSSSSSFVPLQKPCVWDMTQITSHLVCPRASPRLASPEAFCLGPKPLVSGAPCGQRLSCQSAPCAEFSIGRTDRRGEQ